jgi:radical SAM superfamily enzyme YgiQ (UPF0313 family)
MRYIWYIVRTFVSVPPPSTTIKNRPWEPDEIENFDLWKKMLPWYKLLYWHRYGIKYCGVSPIQFFLKEDAKMHYKDEKEQQSDKEIRVQ